MRASICLLSLVVAVAACGNAVDPRPVCEPSCPGDTHCTVNGCEPDNPGAEDLSIPADFAVTCGQTCSGATPYCGPNRNCVSCLMDAHCPVGQICKTVGINTVCVPGCADDSRCANGMKCCTGACIDVSKDRQNCGSCGTVCSSNHSGSDCVNGACTQGACMPGWGDCNMIPGDGCETSLRADPKNCTACGMVCKLPNAVNGCADSMMPPCYIQACNYGFDDCNGKEDDGCETNVVADANNCGACAKPCKAAPQAQVKCINAACQLTGCNQGFADCDGNGVNGCEVTIATDVRNCGGCGMVCPNGQVCKNGGCTCGNCNIPNAKTKCVNNQCAFDGCAQGYADCNNNLNDGCEVNLTSDAANCNQCGMVCPNNAKVCVNSMCTNVPVNPFFNSMPNQTGQTVRNAGDACGTLITVNQAANVVAIAVSNNMNGNGNMRFIIWDHPGHNILYISAPKSFQGNVSSWKQSDVFQTVTLQAGKQYDIGGITDVGATWNYDTAVDNMNGIVSAVQNPNYTNFMMPIMGGHAGADCGIQLF